MGQRNRPSDNIANVSSQLLLITSIIYTHLHVGLSDPHVYDCYMIMYVESSVS